MIKTKKKRNAREAVAVERPLEDGRRKDLTGQSRKRNESHDVIERVPLEKEKKTTTLTHRVAFLDVEGVDGGGVHVPSVANVTTREEGRSKKKTN